MLAGEKNISGLLSKDYVYHLSTYWDNLLLKGAMSPLPWPNILVLWNQIAWEVALAKGNWFYMNNMRDILRTLFLGSQWPHSSIWKRFVCFCVLKSSSLWKAGWPLKYVLPLVPGTTILGKKNFADVIKGEDLKIRKLMWNKW